MKCVICKNEIDQQIFPNGQVWEEGHNAQPVKDGRCCTLCNDEHVIPLRIKKIMEKKNEN